MSLNVFVDIILQFDFVKHTFPNVLSTFNTRLFHLSLDKGT